ncbi:MAG: AEC family transporter [Desulfofustis sp. PB-SRB1]|jgi:malonate transporter|nr:AEC family transporter [Desulfofustis sp. PB-SRB1]MBM1001827.1 AEC family transporter [Desulfofustis sp. PB-SRB1]HBH29692.1 Auxin Efflux carrier [Desulfofustis sp.]HBH31526.1 Auxin Efflux carrier [Desulfofustis sp.]
MNPVIETFFDPILPVFGIMLVGIFCARTGFFEVSAAHAINRFVFYVAVPALLFDLLSQADLGRLQWSVLLSYFGSEMVLFAGGAILARTVLRRGMGESLLLGMAACFGNHVFFVLPIAERIFGSGVVVPITAIIVVDTTLIFGTTIIGLEISMHRGEPWWKVARSFLHSPVLLVIGAGLAINLSAVSLPSGISTFTSFAGGAAAPAALFALGIVLAAPGRGAYDGAAGAIAGLKVIVHPLVAWILLGWVSATQTWHDVALLVAAGPCGAMPFVLATNYRIEASTIGKAVLYSTIASLISLAIIA